MPFLMIYVTHPDETTAQSISQKLLEQKLVACSNIFPITSAYWWEGTIQNEQEWVSVLKTSRENGKAVEKEIEKWHPYQVPCILKWEVNANEKYENWIHQSLISIETKK